MFQCFPGARRRLTITPARHTYSIRSASMSTGAIILLGAFAGLTIFLGLPLAFLRRGTPSLRMFLSMLATGVLLFLLYDVVAKASEPIDEALSAFKEGAGAAT